jgi:hypothetical protein
MDRNFFEFWGQLFLGVAQGQKRVEEMESMFRQGMEGYESIVKIFREVYHLDPPKQNTPNNANLWEGAATKTFQESLRQVMSLWGMVPKDDYQALQEKFIILEKKTAEQEHTIGYLKTLLGERQDNAFSTVNELQTLLTAQQVEFQTLMHSLGVFFQEKKKTPAKNK